MTRDIRACPGLIYSCKSHNWVLDQEFRKKGRGGFIIAEFDPRSWGGSSKKRAGGGERGNDSGTQGSPAQNMAIGVKSEKRQKYSGNENGMEVGGGERGMNSHSPR